MKRKILASLMCLLMMATLLPVGSVAAEEVVFLTNGDFEGGADANGVPIGWTEFDRDSTSAVYSCTLIDEADIPAEEVSAVTPHNGTSFKIQGNVDYYQKLNNLVSGKQYLIEGYVNAPVNNQGPQVFIGKGNYTLTTGTNAEQIFNRFLNGADSSGIDKKTNGWLRFSAVFRYSPDAATSLGADWYLVLRNLNDNPVYYDSISVTELSDNVLFYEGFNTFTNSTNDLLPNVIRYSTVLNNNYGGVGAVDSDNNGVCEIAASANFRQVGLTLTPGPVVDTACTIRLSFRARLGTGTVTSLFVGPYTDTYANPTGYQLTLSNDWKYYEIIMDYDPSVWSSFKFYKGATADGGKWHLDDIMVEKVNDAFVGTGKTLNDPTVTTYTAPAGLTMTTRQYATTSYTATETIKPFVRFATAEETDTALTMTAVYKNEGSKRQLVNVITETLTATASEAAYSTKSMDLSTLGLTAADGVTYTVKTYLWNDSTLKPLADDVVIPIAVAQ